MINAFRLWFIAVYALGFAFFLVGLVQFFARRPEVERQVGVFPSPPAVINWIVALVILVTRIGQLPAGWIALRVIGVALSLYAAVMIPWAGRTLGRSLTPGAAVLKDHALVQTGPFRLVRHPIYSAVAALWLGAGLGTLNWIFLASWPVIVMGVLHQAKTEEGMMRARFGDAYDAYSAGKERLVPRP